MNKRGLAFLVLAVIAVSCCVADTPAGASAALRAAESSDWPQWRGPNRDGIVVNSPKLLDSWPKDGGDSFKPVTAQALAVHGWLPDLPEALAKRIEAAWSSTNRPSSAGWGWWSPEYRPEQLKAFLEKKPELAKYITDFLATLDVADATKYGDFIRRRLCIETPKNKFGVPDGLTWAQLTALRKLKDVGYRTSQEAVWALRGCNRALLVTAMDADTKAVLDMQNIPEKAGFRYMVWDLKGHVTLHVLNLGSAEASPVCIGGLFVDPAGAAILSWQGGEIAGTNGGP